MRYCAIDLFPPPTSASLIPVLEACTRFVEMLLLLLLLRLRRSPVILAASHYFHRLEFIGVCRHLRSCCLRHSFRRERYLSLLPSATIEICWRSVVRHNLIMPDLHSRCASIDKVRRWCHRDCHSDRPWAGFSGSSLCACLRSGQHRFVKTPSLYSRSEILLRGDLNIVVE